MTDTTSSLNQEINRLVFDHLGCPGDWIGLDEDAIKDIKNAVMGDAAIRKDAEQTGTTALETNPASLYTTSPSNPETLIACPFCGGEAKFTERDRSGSLYARCTQCGFEYGAGTDETHVASRWNKRVPSEIWLTFGEYSISQGISSPSKIYISHESGEGGEFNREDFAQAVKEFYEKYF